MRSSSSVFGGVGCLVAFCFILSLSVLIGWIGNIFAVCGIAMADTFVFADAPVSFFVQLGGCVLPPLGAVLFYFF